MNYKEELRDKIAIEAMHAIIAKMPFESLPALEAMGKEERTASGAYGYADAMMRIREE